MDAYTLILSGSIILVACLAGWIAFRGLSPAGAPPLPEDLFSRENIVEKMNDGWMILDRDNVIIDINPAAEKMIDQSKEAVQGDSIKSVLADWPNLEVSVREPFEFELKRNTGSRDGWQYLNVRVSPLMNLADEPFGRLVTWQDITERRMAEDARQVARDEMFVLLNAISSEASEAMSLDEFLSESIYQIIYPFRSHVVGIFLADEKSQDEEEQGFTLTSHFGISASTVDDLKHISAFSPLFGLVLTNHKPLLVENGIKDQDVPASLREIEHACFLMLPMTSNAGGENQFLGCMLLGRKEKPVYSPDEIIRLATICDHIASLIDNDRRRKLSITLSERQRLMRDLHDSVSQKLYGLVTTTEGAQASIEAGNTIDPAEVLTKIGENARQAVREMRLFLYQMQPIDLEKDGIITVLHHRLAAVEGRADIKARLLADEDIALSKDKEIELYFIAMEALNNILRHAKAKTVMVRLKQGRKNVILEIVDDGHGFDMKNLDRAGLGLANMKERTRKINGRIMIYSEPGRGTRIVVLVRKDRTIPANSGRR